MTLKQRIANPGPEAERRFECGEYEAVEGTKRCQHYCDGGDCDVPSQGKCAEWLRVNEGQPGPHAMYPAPEQHPLVPPTASEEPEGLQVRHDLFGKPLPPKPPAPTPEPTRDAKPQSRAVSRDDVPLVRNITDEEIASFRALGASVCICSENVGDVWLVPEYTDKDRLELRIDHAATLTAICAAFPGAKVTSFEPEKPLAQAAPVD